MSAPPVTRLPCRPRKNAGRLTGIVLGVVLFTTACEPTAATAPSSLTPATSARPTVVLIHGFGGTRASWGNLRTLLQQDGYDALYFEYDQSIPSGMMRPIEDLAVLLNDSLRKWHAIPGYSGSTVLIGHSMGGLIARYLVAHPQQFSEAGKISRLAVAGTPSYGAEITSPLGLSIGLEQVIQQRFGSGFTWELHEAWRQAKPALPVLAILGSCPPSQNALCAQFTLAPESDGIVLGSSASLRQFGSDVVFVPRFHMDDMVKIYDRSHDTYQMIKPFLDGRPLPQTAFDQKMKQELLWGMLVLELVDGGGRRQKINEVRFATLRPPSFVNPTSLIASAWLLPEGTHDLEIVPADLRRFAPTCARTEIRRYQVTVETVTAATPTSAPMNVANVGPVCGLPPVTLTLTAIDAGSDHTCGIDTSGAAWCWGVNGSGEIGDGTLTADEIVRGLGGIRDHPTLVAGNLKFTSISAGTRNSCGIAANGGLYCWGLLWTDSVTLGAPVPTRIDRGLRFRQISAGGGTDICGIDLANDMYCYNHAYGDRSVTRIDSVKWRFSKVPGGPWRTLSYGGSHLCGITTGGNAYCWNNHTSGTFFTPTPVAGNLTFSALSAGYGVTCALVSSGQPYCWDGTLRPTRAVVQEPLVSIQVGGAGEPPATLDIGGRVVGRTASGSVYTVILGNSPFYSSRVITMSMVYFVGTGERNSTDQLPVSFRMVSSGSGHHCGITANGSAVCWGGLNTQGQLGFAGFPR